MSTPVARCHVCGGLDAEVMPGYDKLLRITSDCRVWRPGGRIAICRACGCVQNVVDAAWYADVAEINADYSFYQQGGGIDQAVFDPSKGLSVRRSEGILRQLAELIPSPPSGALLDIGCGNGALLREVGRFFPGWRLHGWDINDDRADDLKEIVGFQGLLAGSIGQNSGTYDVVTMIYVLEHVVDPVAFLRQVKARLADGGVLVVQVPDRVDDPVDLLVIDHVSHFSREVLEGVLCVAGYDVVHSGCFTPKAISVIARPHGRSLSPQVVPDKAGLAAQIKWLNTVADGLRSRLIGGPAAIFGAGLMGTWLRWELGNRVCAFVDEDPARIGRPHEGLPVHGPADPHLAGNPVIVALPPALARTVAARMDHGGSELLWADETGSIVTASVSKS